MSPDEAFLARMRAAPDAEPARVAREVGISNRLARRLVAELEADRNVRRQRIARGVLVAAAVVVLGAVAWMLRAPTAASARAPSSTAALSSADRAQERALYDALARRDPGRAPEALAHLGSADETLRLAALRYLATVSASEHVGALLPLADDASDRVRPVAIQLLGKVPEPAVEDMLVAASLAAERPLGERLLALNALRERAPDRPEELARELLPVLRDGAAVLRERTAALLAQLTGKRPTSAQDPEVLHAAWRDALGVTQ